MPEKQRDLDVLLSMIEEPNPYYLHDVICDPDDWPHRNGGYHQFPLCCSPSCEQCKKEGLQ